MCAAIGFALDLDHVGWAVTAALVVVFSTFLVFLLLLYAHPERASGRFWERIGETLLGVGVACVCRLLVPVLRERSGRSGTAPASGA